MAQIAVKGTHKIAQTGAERAQPEEKKVQTSLEKAQTKLKKAQAEDSSNWRLDSSDEVKKFKLAWRELILR